MPANIRLGYKWVEVANTPAYCPEKFYSDGPVCDDVNIFRQSDLDVEIVEKMISREIR